MLRSSSLGQRQRQQTQPQLDPLRTYRSLLRTLHIAFSHFMEGYQNWWDFELVQISLLLLFSSKVLIILHKICKFALFVDERI